MATAPVIYARGRVMEPKSSGKKSKTKDTGWSDIYGGQAFIVPMGLQQHPNRIRLTPHANKLFNDLSMQWGPRANGYLYAGMKLMSEYGWTSARTLTDALRELVHYGLLVQTIQGGKNKASYYGFTFRRIIEIPERPFDRPIPSLKPLNTWLTEVPPFCAKSLVHPRHKVCARTAQNEPEFMHPVHKSSSTYAPSAQVSPVSDGQFMHPVHSYAYMPSHAPAGVLMQGRAGGSEASAVDVDLGLESNRAEPKTNRRRPKLDSAA